MKAAFGIDRIEMGVQDTIKFWMKSPLFMMALRFVLVGYTVLLKRIQVMFFLKRTDDLRAYKPVKSTPEYLCSFKTDSIFQLVIYSIILYPINRENRTEAYEDQKEIRGQGILAFNVNFSLIEQAATDV
jgi:hypothetical protein